jgi:hypothetical protein
VGGKDICDLPLDRQLSAIERGVVSLLRRHRGWVASLRPSAVAKVAGFRPIPLNIRTTAALMQEFMRVVEVDGCTWVLEGERRKRNRKLLWLVYRRATAPAWLEGDGRAAEA